MLLTFTSVSEVNTAAAKYRATGHVVKVTKEKLWMMEISEAGKAPRASDKVTFFPVDRWEEAATAADEMRAMGKPCSLFKAKSGNCWVLKAGR